MITVRASGLHRVMNCTGSHALAAAIKEELPDSDAAKEGDAAHFVAECLFLEKPAPARAPNGWPIDADMASHALEYVKGLPADALSIEEECSWLATPGVRIAVRNDAAWMHGDDLYLRDFKYGWRVVDVEDNWQLIAGAIGYCRKHEKIPARIHLSIYQPRPYHPDGPLREVTLTPDELIAEHDRIVAICPEIDREPVHTVLITGEHCYGCKAAIFGTCGAHIRAAHNAVDVALSNAKPADFPHDALPGELDTLTRAGKIIEERLDYAKDIALRAIKSGRIVPGYAVEPTNTHRVWKDLDAAKKATNISLTKEVAISPAEAERRGASEEFIKSQTDKPPGALKLVKRDADKVVKAKIKKAEKAKK